MTQFKSRFSSHPPRSYSREADIKLRMSPKSYSEENDDSPYHRRQVETQNIKKLSFWDNADQESGEEDEWAKRQSPAFFILIIVVLVVACTLLWFLFRWASGDNSSTPPIIAADTAPFKVRPENPGGMMIPHQDKLIYGRLSHDTPQPIERLLPPPEQPMVAPPQMAPAPMISPPGVTSSPNIGPQNQQPYSQGQGYISPQQGYPTQPTMQQGTTPQFQPQQPQPYPPFQAQAPYPQQPMPNQAYPAAPQQQALYETPASPQIPLKAASNPIPPKHLTAVEDIKPANELDNEANEDTVAHDEQSELDQLIAKEAETPLRPSSKMNNQKNTKPLAIDSQKYKVQIASLPSRSMAEQEMKRLRTQHGAAFQSKPWNIQKINLGPDRGYTHRLVVGSFSNHDAAAKFCKKLRGEKIGCLVVAPAG